MGRSIHPALQDRYHIYGPILFLFDFSFCLVICGNVKLALSHYVHSGEFAFPGIIAFKPLSHLGIKLTQVLTSAPDEVMCFTPTRKAAICLLM